MVGVARVEREEPIDDGLENGVGLLEAAGELEVTGFEISNMGIARAEIAFQGVNRCFEGSNLVALRCVDHCFALPGHGVELGNDIVKFHRIEKQPPVCQRDVNFVNP
jgi:hypothetical protein